MLLFGALRTTASSTACASGGIGSWGQMGVQSVPPSAPWDGSAWPGGVVPPGPPLPSPGVVPPESVGGAVVLVEPGRVPGSDGLVVGGAIVGIVNGGGSFVGPTWACTVHAKAALSATPSATATPAVLRKDMLGDSFATQRRHPPNPEVVLASILPVWTTGLTPE